VADSNGVIKLSTPEAHGRLKAVHAQFDYIRGPKSKKEEKENFLLKIEAIFTIQTNQYDTASEVNFQPNGIQCWSRWLYKPSKESDIMFFRGLIAK